MDRQRSTSRGRFGETASDSRRPTGSYRSQPSGSYKSRSDYAAQTRPGSRSTPGDSYTRRPAPRPSATVKWDERAARRRRLRKRRIAALLILLLLIAGVVAAICAKKNQTVHQMPTIVRTEEYQNIRITEET